MTFDEAEKVVQEINDKIIETCLREMRDEHVVTLDAYIEDC